MVKNVARRILWILLALTSFLLLSALFSLIGIYYYASTNVPTFSQEDFKTSATTFLYDQDGKLITKLHGRENRVPLTLDNIPPAMRNAVLAVEDTRFYQHPGFDLQGLLRAAWVDYQTGSYTEGGSTITQQLVKNVYLSTEKTFQRKLRELYLAYHLDRTFSKDQILELYLNRIYLGEGAYGVAAASQTYFDKEINQLTLSETALIAGLSKNPSNFNPFRNPEEAAKRRDTVLALMYNNGWINYEQYTTAKEETLTLNPKGKEKDSAYPYGYFVDAVLDEVTANYGITEEQVFSGGYQIYTTLDRTLQESAEQTMANEAFFPDTQVDQRLEGALVLLDAKTGEVKALVGGRTYKARRGYNRATQMKRQPGSAIKPLTVYAPAFEKGLTPESFWQDEKLNINGYEPQNYDGIYRGQVSLRQAVGQSINTTAVSLLNYVGVGYGFTFGQQLGLPLTDEDRTLSLALGGLYKGVSPLQMSNAYAAFANGGKRVNARTVVQIYDQEQKPLLKKVEPYLVMKESTAYQVNDVLRSTVQYGTGQGAQLNRPVAGKTGTTELPPAVEFQGVTGNKDAWFVGYTPQFVCTVWMGYDKTDRNHYMKKIYGGTYPAQIFRAVMEKAHESLPILEFPTAPGYGGPPAGGSWKRWSPPSPQPVNPPQEAAIPSTDANQIPGAPNKE